MSELILNEENYSAIVVEINKTVPIKDADFIHNLVIMGNLIIASKDTKEGDIGIYFPIESLLSNDFVRNNNLYVNKELNSDIEKKGYINEDRRVRYVKLRNSKSEGLFLPLSSLSYIEGFDYNNLKVGDAFNSIVDDNGITHLICEKYIPPIKVKSNNINNTFKKNRNAIADVVREYFIENQFKFHDDTKQLYRNLHNFNPQTNISISYKLHGSSGIVANILTKRKLSLFEKILKKFGVNIQDTDYSYVYSSGKPKSNIPKGIINKFISPNKSYYKDDIWLESYNYLKDFVTKGLSVYFEIVGFTKNGSPIQNDYDYGCIPPENGVYLEGVNYKIFIYRINYTSVDGKTFEFTTKQINDWCENRGLKNVPHLQTCIAYEIADEHKNENWHEEFLYRLALDYNNKKCYLCKNDVVEEGIVIRNDDNMGFDVYKLKSSKFYEYETKELDKGVNNEG